MIPFLTVDGINGMTVFWRNVLMALLPQPPAVVSELFMERRVFSNVLLTHVIFAFPVPSALSSASNPTISIRCRPSDPRLTAFVSPMLYDADGFSFARIADQESVMVLKL